MDFRNGNELCEEHCQKITKLIVSDFQGFQVLILVALCGICGFSTLMVLALMFSEEIADTEPIILWFMVIMMAIIMGSAAIGLLIALGAIKRRIKSLYKREFTWKYGVMTQVPQRVSQKDHGRRVQIDGMSCNYREDWRTLIGVQEGDPFLIVYFNKSMHAMRI